jgi:hypothetical protein
MTGTSCPDLLAALKQRQRDLEVDATAVRARLDEVAEMIALIEQPQRRRGRPRKTDGATEPPLHVDGGIHTPPDTDTTDTELPL